MSGELYSWGSNISGQLGHGDCEPHTAIKPIGGLPIGEVEDIACGSHSVIVVGQPAIAEVPSRQYMSISQSHLETYSALLPNGKHSKGFEVLLSEQRHL